MSDTHEIRTKVSRRVLVRAVLTVVVSALLTGGLFSLFYIDVFRAPGAHDLPIALAGSDTAAVQSEVGDRFKIVSVSNDEEGLTKLAHREVYGVITLDRSAQQVHLSYTSVDGSSVLEYMQPVAKRISEKANMPLRISNTTPEIAANASPGRSIFFGVFGTVLTGFVLAQALSSVGKQLQLRLLAKVAAMVSTSIVAGVVISVILDPWYQVTPGIFWQMWPLTSLLCLSTVATGMALIEIVGPVGQVVTAVLFVTLGNATATGMLPMPFLPPAYQVMSLVLPTGNVVRAIEGQAFFANENRLLGYLVPVLWTLVSLTALTVVSRFRLHKPALK